MLFVRFSETAREYHVLGAGNRTLCDKEKPDNPFATQQQWPANGHVCKRCREAYLRGKTIH